MVRERRPRAEIVRAVAATTAVELGYGTVVVNLYRPVTDDFAVAHVHGSPDACEALSETTSRWTDWRPLLADRFRCEGAYFARAGSVTLGEMPVHLPTLEWEAGPDAWDPGDALVVPLLDARDEILGLLSVDEPRSGRRPGDDELRSLATVGAHLGAILELADGDAAGVSHAAALERLALTSVRVLATLDLDEALAETCAAIGEALGFAEVEVAVVQGDRLVTRQVVGAVRHLDGRGLDDLHRLLSGDPSDGVVTRLTGADGRLLGVLRAGGAVDGPLPERERLRLVRTFADQVQGTLTSASHAAAVDSEARKAAMLEASLDAILTVDAGGRLVEFNRAAERTFGHRRADVLGRGMASLIIPPEHREGMRRYLDGIRAATVVGRRLELSALRADGTAFPCEIAVVAIETDGPPLLTAYLRDVSDRVMARESLERERDQARQLSLHDRTTGLLNRAGALELIDQRLPALVADGRGLLLVSVGLDDYDTIVESVGHAQAEELLQAAGRRLSAGWYFGWTVAHPGTGEFLVLAEQDEPGTDGVEEAAELAVEVQAALGSGFAVDGVDVHVASTAGYAALREPTVDAGAALRWVSVARHRARRAGEERLAYDAATDDSRRQLVTLSALRRAIDRGELELHYQPILSVADGSLEGLEGLVRWRRDGALIPPGEFIGLAETSGLIVPIGEWVIEEAARQAAAWAADGLAVPVVGVNVSPRQLSRPALSSFIAGALERHGVRPDRFCVEVTESAIDARSGGILRFTQELDELGVRCAIDDFGSEYSSLARLATLPVKAIKLDRGFLRAVPSNPRATSLLGGVLQVTRMLGTLSIVEGVEQPEQAGLLADMGADLVQGFLFDRPLPADVARTRMSPAVERERSGPLRTVFQAS